MSEVPKFLADNPSVNPHAIYLADTFDATHPLIILHQLSGLTSYFDVYSLSMSEYENEEITKIHLNAKDTPWVLSTNEYSEREMNVRSSR